MAKIDLEVIKAELKPKGKELVPLEARPIPMLTEAEYFRPTAKQRKLKEAFRSACKDLPVNRTDITVEFVKRHISSKELELWWNVPGFIQWFRRDESISERLSYLYHLRLDAVEQILEDDTGAITARDKIMAGAELDKIAKTLTDAKDSVEKKDTKDLATRIKEQMEKVKVQQTPQQIAAEIVAKKLEMERPKITLPDLSE